LSAAKSSAETAKEPASSPAASFAARRMQRVEVVPLGASSFNERAPQLSLLRGSHLQLDAALLRLREG